MDNEQMKISVDMIETKKNGKSRPASATSSNGTNNKASDAKGLTPKQRLKLLEKKYDGMVIGFVIKHI
jgi:hypothetical protein